ncbi:MAG: DUF4339 domain-containing protein [Bacteroidota bacterium]
MTKYYIHLNNEQFGPFTIEEIRTKGISKDTKVWYEGLPSWVNASEIESFSIIFTTPPPLEFAVVSNFTSTPPPVNTYSTDNYEASVQESKILGLGKTNFYIAATVAAIILAYLGFSSYQNHRSLEVQEQVTNAEQGEQLQQQQALLEQQQAQIAEQEKREKERLEAEAQEKFKSDRDKLINELSIANQYLSKSKAKLADVSGFKVLRSQSTREREIAEAQIAVDQIEREVQKLEIAIVDINRKIK